jgi:signal transduction histidine kinase
MNTIHLTDGELEMARHALKSYLNAFGHNEADTLEQIKRVIAKLDTARPDGEEPRFIA